MWTRGVSVQRPAPDELEAFQATLGLRRLSYEQVGCTLAEATPDGFRRSDDVTDVPGDNWAGAVAALHRWAMFDHDWVETVPSAPSIVAGQDLGVLAMAAGLHWLVPNRIVRTIDEADCVGFSHGTLDGHIVAGEELFAVERAGGQVRFRITAISRPADLLAGVGSPLIRRFQRRFVTGALSGFVNAV